PQHEKGLFPVRQEALFRHIDHGRWVNQETYIATVYWRRQYMCQNIYCHGLLATTIHVSVHVQRVSAICSITVLLLRRSNDLVVPILDDWPPARMTPQRGIISSTYFMFSDHTAKNNNRTDFVCFFLLFL